MFVNEIIAREFAKNGKLIGKTIPSQETKGGWWEVYSYNDRIVAACVDQMYGVSCGEEITLDQLHLYTE